MLIRQKQIGTIAYLGGVMSTPEPFTWSWGNMLVYSQEALCGEGEHIHVDRATVSLHDVARHEILSRTRGDWVLMLDTDMTFEPDFAARLVAVMAKYNADVVTGIYSFKASPNLPVLYMYNPDTERHEIVSDWDRSREVFPVDAAGAGCLLVRRSVFERITGELKQNPFDRYEGKGEDMSFFIRCRKLGIKTLCAWRVEAQHLQYELIAPSSHYEQGSIEPDTKFERHIEFQHA